MTARPPATASGWRPRRGAGRRHPEAVDACGVVLLGSDPPPGRTASLSGGRRRVAAGRAACQRAARVLRSATALRVTHRPPRGSDGSYGPCGPAWTRASRPSTTSQGPGAPPNSERRTGPEPPARDWGRGRRVPGGGAGCAVSLCRRRVDVLTEPTGGPFSRGRRGPFFSCHFQDLPAVGAAAPAVDATGAPCRREDVHRLLREAADPGRSPPSRGGPTPPPRSNG